MYRCIPAPKFRHLAFALLSFAVSTACRTQEGGLGDPLADEEYARASTTRPADVPETEASATVGQGKVTLREHKPFMCEDGGRYFKHMQKYRQGCLQCTCIADEKKERIDCREIKDCRK